MTKEDRAYCIKHGYCTRCGEVKTENGRRTCKACAATLREYQNTYWAKMPQEKKQPKLERMRQYHKERYEELKAAGLCVICKKPVETGHVRCKKCTLKNNRSSLEAYRRKHDVTPRILFGDGYHCKMCGKRWHPIDFRKDKPKELKPFERRTILPP